MASINYLGPLLRLDGLDFDVLPPVGASRDRVQQFMMALLDESLELIGSVDTYYANERQRNNPSGWKSKGNQTYKGTNQIGGAGNVVVELLERSIPKSDLQAAVTPQFRDVDNVPADAYPERVYASTIAAQRNPKKKPTSETWACRRSLHNNEGAAGTGSWDEFSVRMKDFHVETEKDMTPTVPHAQKVLRWPAAGLVNQLDATGFVDSGPGPWTGFTLDLVEMEHNLKAFPLKNRVFPVLQMTCRTANEAKLPEILVVSIPINGWKGSQLPQDVELRKLVDLYNVVIGSYASVERFRVLPKDQNNHNTPTSTKTVSTLSGLRESFKWFKRSSVASATPSQAAANRQAVVVSNFPAKASPSVPPAGGADTPGNGVVAVATTIAEGPVQSGAGGDIQPAPDTAAAVRGGDQVGSNEVEPQEINEQDTQIEWTMATASHARGWLPLFIQTPAVPKKIAIDVPLFLSFLQKQRALAAGQVQAQNANQQEAGQPGADQPAAQQPVANAQAINNQQAGNAQSG
ncbi:hypothetical protein SEUCBS139899_000960 [Sporothrix eucalyptigena]|uniref:DUF3074 domain-containing protein n=1 Tax=Sporothrix eucalyptigena TaxID=1812306 RepID=A0ABP0BJR2_9PEZI